MLRLGLGMGRAGGYRPGLRAESVAIASAMTTPPSGARLVAIDTLVAALIDGGVWSRLGLLHVFAAADAQAALLNWKAPTGTPAAVVGSPTFTTDRGYAGNDTDGYVSTQQAWNAIPGVAQNDCHAGAYGVMAVADPLVGIAGVASAVTIAFAAGPVLSTRLNHGASVVGDTITTTPTHFLVSRAASNTYERYIDGVAGTAGSVNSTTPTTGTLVGLHNGTAFAPSSFSLRALHAGSALSAPQALALAQALEAYMTAVGANA
jgi:hypothetical protein